MGRIVLVVAVLAAACASDPTTDAPASEGATRPLELTDPATTPPVNQSIASVPLDDVVFDTFDGGSITLSEAPEDTIARLFDAIAPLDGPDYDAASATSWLTEEDLVVGYVDPSGSAWGYPVRILNKHELVNDRLGGQDVLITYCPLCGTGVVYARNTEVGVLSFSNTSALLENDLVMVDRETGTYWWQVAGRAVVGELTGAELELLPSRTTSWAAWRSAHPNTAVLRRPAGRDYSRDSFVGYPERVDAGQTPFPVSDEVMADARLSPATRVVAVTIGDQTMAVAAAPARTVTETIGGRTITFTTDGIGARAVDATDQPVPTRTGFWFSILSAFPDVVVAG